MVRRHSRWVFRFLMVALALAAGWKTTRRLVALEIARLEPSVEGIGVALAWDPENPRLYESRARLRQSRVEDFDLEGARADWERALKLNRHYWLYWLEYGRILEMAGRSQPAQEALTEAIRLSPRNGTYHWALANFFIRGGQLERAIQPMKRALQLEDLYLRPAAQLLLGLGVPVETLDEIWPERPPAVWFLFDFLVHHWDRGQAVWGDAIFRRQWQRLLALQEGVDLSPQHLQPYFRQLVERGFYRRARLDWAELMDRNGAGDTAFREGRELAWNGGFELPPLQDIFDWQIQPNSAFEVRFARLEGRAGTTGLRIRFTGRENPRFAHLRQRMALDPGRRYRLSFWAQARGLSSEEGFFWVVRNLATGSQSKSDAMSNTEQWQQSHFVFTAPPGSGWFELALEGLPSDRSIRRTEATILLDDVSVRLW